MRARVGLVGARGYVGQELLRVLARSPLFEVAFVSSRTHAGRLVGSGGLGGEPRGREASLSSPTVGRASPPVVTELLRFEDLGPEEIAAKGADAVVIALPNDHAAPVVAALDRLRPDTVIVDVSADHRLDEGWVYGLPELFRDTIRGARRIANPGCYATAVALAVAPLAEMLAGPAIAFGVSGYSGAGTTPSPRNDQEALRDNLMPYSLVGHAHEREVTRHVARVSIMPHVAPFFRGITATVSLPLARSISLDELRAAFARRYEGEPMVRLTDEIPQVRDAADRPWATIGGFAVDATAGRAVVVSTLDNLLKGAASQAVQNLNLALGFPELAGIAPWEP